MREISFDFHRMESICDELALLSDMFTKQVLSPLHDAYSALDPEISGTVQTRFHAVMERAARLRGEQNDLVALIDYASNAYKKSDRKAVSDLVEINEHTHLMLDGLQQELRGVANGHAAQASGAFAIMPDGYSRDVSHTSLRALGEVANFAVEKDAVAYSLTTSALAENQAASYDMASPIHNFLFPKFDFHADKVTDSAHHAGKFVVPAIVVTGVGGAFFALYLQTRKSPSIEQKRVSGKSIASDSRVKTMTKLGAKGALTASALAGGLAVLKTHSSIAFTARDKQSISSNTVLFDEGGDIFPVRVDDRRVIYDSLNALGFFTFSMIALPKFIHIENFRIIVDTVSRDIFLKDYYHCVRNRSLDIDAFAAQKSVAVPTSARARLEDGLAATDLKEKIDPQMQVPSRKEADELHPFLADNGTDSHQESPYRTHGQVHDLDDFAVQNGVATPISARAKMEDDLAALNLKKLDPQMVIPPRKEAGDLASFVSDKNTNSHQEYLHLTTGQIHDLDDFAVQNGVATPISARAKMEDDLAALNLKNLDPQIVVPARKEAWELKPLMFQERIDSQIVVPPSYKPEPLMRVIFPDADHIPWNFLLKYDPNFTTWMERFDIRVRILPPDYGYIREFVPVSGDDQSVLHKDIVAVGKLAGFQSTESEDADVTGNTNRVSVKELDKFEVIGETSDILWKHLVYRDSDISEPQMKKDWAEILGGKHFSDTELDAGDQYERKLYDSVFEFLVKSVYVPEIQKRNVSEASHASPMMKKAVMEQIENPAYERNAVHIQSSRKDNPVEEEIPSYSATKSGNQAVFASKPVGAADTLDGMTDVSAGADGFLHVASNKIDAAELIPNEIRENMSGPSGFGVNTVQASDIDSTDSEVLPILAKTSGARVDVSESELTSQFTQWSVSFTGNTYKGNQLAYAQSASLYLGAKTGAKATDARDIEPANGNSVNSVIVNAKKSKDLSLDETEIGKNESAELTDKQIEAILSALAGATIGTGIVLAAKKAAGALHNGGAYPLPEHVSFESLQKSAVTITGEMLISLAKYGVELGSIATLVDAVCKSVWTQGSAVSAVITYSSVALLSAHKMYHIYKG